MFVSKHIIIKLRCYLLTLTLFSVVAIIPVSVSSTELRLLVLCLSLYLTS